MTKTLQLGDMVENYCPIDIHWIERGEKQKNRETDLERTVGNEAIIPLTAAEDPFGAERLFICAGN